MSITFPISFPTSSAPRWVQWRPFSVVGVQPSDFTLAADKYRHAGKRWEVSIAYPFLTRLQGDELTAALQQLDGPFGSVLFGPTGPLATVRGTWAGSPLVNGANQSGLALVLDGFTAGATVKAGDWLQLGSGAGARLHRNLKDVTADGGGNATLDIWPAHRDSPADNGAIVIASPKGVFRLREAPQWEMSPAGDRYLPIAFELEEDF